MSLHVVARDQCGHAIVDSYRHWILTPYMDEISAGKLVARKNIYLARAPSDRCHSTWRGVLAAAVIIPAAHEGRHLHGSFLL